MGILAREVRHVPSWQRDGGEVPTPSRTVREPLAGRGSRCPAPTPLPTPGPPWLALAHLERSGHLPFGWVPGGLRCGVRGEQGTPTTASLS